MTGTRQHTSKPSLRAEAARERLIEAAAEIFLEHGFGMATVDVIAHHAKASKKTLYSHFAGKEEIFVAAVERLCQRTLAPLHQLDIQGDDPEALLVEFGTRLLAQVLAPEAIALHRVAISEATRFPDLARLFYRTGPAMVQRILSERLAALRESGRLRLDDSGRIASLFIQMVLGEAQRKTALAVAPPPTANEARRHAAAVARLLLRALPNDCGGLGRVVPGV